MKPKPLEILITGGSSEIGAAMAARRFELGDRVTVTASSDASLKKVLEQYRGAGVRAEGLVFDLANPDRSAAAVAKLGRVDAVVLNACERVTTLRALHDLTEKQCREYLDANIHGNIWLMRQLLPGMKERKFGRCVFVSSISAMGAEKYPLYCTAKAAVEGLFMNLAIDYGDKGVLCNVLRLGVMKTQRTKRFWRSEKYMKAAAHLVPQGRLGQPEHAAIALDPLLARETYMNGSVVTVSGGLPLTRFPILSGESG